MMETFIHIWFLYQWSNECLLRNKLEHQNQPVICLWFLAIKESYILSLSSADSLKIDQVHMTLMESSLWHHGMLASKFYWWAIINNGVGHCSSLPREEITIFISEVIVKRLNWKNDFSFMSHQILGYPEEVFLTASPSCYLIGKYVFLESACNLPTW